MTYLGSKAKYSKYIAPILQSYIDEHNSKIFIDCCVGGANIIDKIKCETRIGIDNNKNLIALYKEVQKGDFSFPEKISREDWDNCKNGNAPDWFIGLVSIFASYNTRGFSGGFIHGEVGEKQYRGRINTFKRQIPSLYGINFKYDDYTTLLTYKDAVIYIDPPYANTKKYDTSKDFNREHFWETMREVSKNNKIFISELTAPDDFICIWEFEGTHQLGGKVFTQKEKLFTL